KTQARIVEVALKAVTAIGIENGPSHTEIIVTNNGPKIVELGARLGGDNITTHLVPLSTGVDMVKNSIEIALGQMPDLSKKFSKGAAIRYFETSVGQIMSIDGVMEAKAMDGVRQISFIKGLGEFANAISNSSDRIGFIIAQADTAEKAIEKCEMAMNRIKIGVKS
ncbi:MAG: lactate dehydrogenase, partial [Candidatus Firestonebacteria bacterium]|nr:lactate dehydrogenase [Candidatus Firestonebacteria bacterium]